MHNPAAPLGLRQGAAPSQIPLTVALEEYARRSYNYLNGMVDVAEPQLSPLHPDDGALDFWRVVPAVALQRMPGSI
ncbi:MAG: hypothetical protein HY706_03785 [Candidatus Hydrogenedentes bacterium]|nr:hypothetical protein [Candidatus Hydrogenedentota bacterium]